jgi:thioredoxin reductase
MHDVLIIGGSYAGLSAALQLARAYRNVLVIDDGKKRNRFAEAAHGFLGQDGRTPEVIAADARAQLLAYRTVRWIDGFAEAAEITPNGFAVRQIDGESIFARRLILAFGVADTLPEIPGLSERWGKAVFHCPYCHAYELGRGAIGVLAVSEASLHHALLLPDWGPTTFFVNNAFAPTPVQFAQLRDRGVRVETAPVVRISGSRADVELRDGRVVSLAGLFTLSCTAPASPLAAQLGCAMADGPLGPFIETDVFMETTVAGVFACGDAARAMGAVAFAVADGAMAGAAVHQSLIFRAR